MKTLFNTTCRIVLAVLIVSCSKDENLPPDPEAIVPVDVQFGADTSYMENTENNDITIEFSKPAISSGAITVKVISAAPLFFTTIPAPVNNEILIPVEKGASSAKFKFNPRDDWFIEGHKLVTFELKSVSQGFSIGLKNDLLIDIFDDELKWKPLSYETITGDKRTKKTLEYMQDGKLAKVHLETQAAQGTVHTSFTYHYDAHNKLQRIENSNGLIDFFTWENGKIVKSELKEAGVITSHKIYNYNNEGKIQSVYINESNSEVTTVEYYEYLNNNLKKKEVWNTFNMLTWQLMSTQTFETYLAKENPFQMNEILPLNISQPQLPLSLRSEENGGNILTSYTYEYNSTGRPVKRTATGEVTTFSYY